MAGSGPGTWRERLARPGAAGAVALAAALVSTWVACAHPGGGSPHHDAEAARARSALRAGAGLYEAGEFVRAARAFGTAAGRARAAGDRGLTRNATVAECTAWLRGRRLPELAECSERLQVLVRRERHSDPGVNTLIALGAVAGKRPLPPYKVPAHVESLLQTAASEAN